MNEFKTVVFSIDYRVAPENKYPNLIDENIRAYEKIVMKTKEMFGFKIRRLVVTGDSAGGLMCLNIVKHAIKNNLRAPDGIVLIYPCKKADINPRFENIVREYDSFFAYVNKGQLH